jgi:nitrogen-specific signal transduction histidine kinase
MISQWEFKSGRYNSPGIGDRLKQAIFARLESESTRGSRIGLTLVKLLVNQCGGQIRVEDRMEDDPSQGACFVMLPHRPG